MVRLYLDLLNRHFPAMLDLKKFVTVYIWSDNNYHASWYKSRKYKVQH